jgi:hypothetical protein
MAGRKKLTQTPIIRTFKMRFYETNAADMELLARIDALPQRKRVTFAKQAFLFGGLMGADASETTPDDADLSEAADSFLG